MLFCTQRDRILAEEQIPREGNQHRRPAAGRERPHARRRYFSNWQAIARQTQQRQGDGVLGRQAKLGDQFRLLVS